MKLYFLHSPREIISTAGKTEHDARWKRKQSWKLFIHISNKSASIKTKEVPIKSSSFDLPLFYSKSCKLKTSPVVILRVFIFVMKGPSLDVKVVSFGINVAYFKQILTWSHCKELLFTLAEEAIRSSKYITRTKPWNSRQEAYTAKIYSHSLSKLSERF